MAGSDKFSLQLVIKAVDNATAPLAAVNAKIAKLTAPVRQLGASLKGIGSELGMPKVGAALSNVGSALKGVGGEALALGTKLAAIGGAAGFALYSIVKGAVDAGDKLGEMSQRVGLSVDAFASLQYAAAQADVEQEAFNASMDIFNKQLGQAKAGKGSLLAFLKDVGPAFAKQVKGARNTEEALSLMTDALSRIKDPSKRAAMAAAAFGKSGLQMGQFLGQGSAEIQKMQARFIELAGSQKDFAEGAGGLDNAMRDTETAFMGLRNAAAGALFPALTKLAQAVTAFAVKNREGLQQWAEKTGKAIAAWVEGGGLDRLGKSLAVVGATVATVVDKLGGLEGVAKLVAGVMAAPLAASTGKIAFEMGKLGVESAALAIKLGSPVAKALGDFSTAMSAGYKATEALKLALIANPATAALGAFSLALVGVGAAAYQTWKHWGDLKLAFSDLTNDPLEMMARNSRQLREDLEWIAGWTPPALLFKGGKALVGAITDQPWLGAKRPELGAAAAAGEAPAASVSESKVTVEFKNMPKGARVRSEGNALTEWLLGPSNAVP